MTTLETQTETPDDLSAALSKTSDAFEAITVQIADLQSEMRRRTARLDELEVLTLEKSRHVAQLREQVDQAQEKLSRARIAAGVVRGGRSEKAAVANVKALETELAGLQQAFTGASAANSAQNTQIRAESDSINERLEEDQKTLEGLQLTRSELKAEKQERKEALGQAIYVAIADEMRGLLEAERKHEEALAEQRALRLAQQKSIAERLADWPQLASKLEEELSPLEKPEPEVAPAVKFAQRMLKSLDVLQELKEQSMRMGHPAIEPTPQIDTRMAVRRLALPEDFIYLVLTSVGGLNLIEQRRYEIKDYVRQVEQLERDRQFYRELTLYNRSSR